MNNTDDDLAFRMTPAQRARYNQRQTALQADMAYERSLLRDGKLPGDLDNEAAARTRAAAEERHQRLERGRRR